ncbi:MAG: methyltransferase domain-containing protein [Fibromonadaceae bacterium]|nr:methyltransferase domain-containing protein [Fibromonadaceae bacterium]
MNFNAKAHRYDLVSEPQLELAKELFNMSLDYLPDTPPALLDIGCGTGHLSLGLAGLFPKSLDCLDVSKEMLLVCKEKLQANFPNAKWRLFENDAEDFEPNIIYDAIYCSAAIQWFKNLSAFLAMAKKWLKPGGFLAIGALGEKTLQEIRKAYKEAAERQVETKAKFYSQHELISVFKKAGFSLEDSEECIYMQGFENPVSALKSLNSMGVTGMGKKPLNRMEFQKLKDALLKTKNENFPVNFSWELMAMIFSKST